MRTSAVLLPVVLWSMMSGAAGAQPAGPTITITVVDPTGGVIVGAHVTVTPEHGNALEAETGQYGTAQVRLERAARVAIRAELPGFQPATVDSVSVRRDIRRTLRLALPIVKESVEVGRDPRERASDPRSDAFAAVLGAAEIRELPDDADEMERVLKDMSGPGAVIRVNGFRGGRLPPKDQIAQIRFRRNMFAADVHEPGVISVEIVTKPGLGAWTGSSTVGLRDGALNARNAFAPVKPDEHLTRGQASASGPLWKKRTSLAVSADRTSAFDSQAVSGVTPWGPLASAIARPLDVTNASVRMEHALSASQQARLEVQHASTGQENLGVGTFDLPSRAYDQHRSEAVARGSIAGGVGTWGYNEARLSWQRGTTRWASRTDAPTVLVLNAFTDGGAQVQGARAAATLEASDDLDITRGHHAWRAGFLLTRASQDSTEQRNALGTYTFGTLQDFVAGTPATFTRTVGDPAARLTQLQFASYVQDDVRVSPRLTLSAGVRQEWQDRIGGLHLGPRGGVAWSPFRSGRVTVRGGAGLFFDWFDADAALRARQLDGAHQRIETVLAPQFPLASDQAANAVLSNGRVRLASRLSQPTILEVNAGVERTFGPVRLAVQGIHRRGSHELRGIDANAPSNGIRPDPNAGPITEIRSVARSGAEAVNLTINVVQPERHLFAAATYTLARAWNEADSPFSLSADAGRLGAERGPSLTDARHRLMAFLSAPLARSLTAGVSIVARSALPYDITTGRDDNGDTLLTDRPSGVTRNAGRGRASVDISTRVAWRTAFGKVRSAPPSGPQVRIVRGDGDTNPLADMPAGERAGRFGLEFYAQAFNLLNRLNASSFGSVVASPLFGRAVAASAPRRVEVGVRFSS